MELEYELNARVEFLGNGVYRVVWTTVHLESEDEYSYVGPAAGSKQEAVAQALERINGFITQVKERTIEMPAGDVWDDELSVPLSVDEDATPFVIGWYIGQSTDDYEDMYANALQVLHDLRSQTEALSAA